MLSAGTGAGGIGAAESSAGIGDIGALVLPQLEQPPHEVSQPQPVSQQLFLQQNRRLMASRIGVHEQHFGAQPPHEVSQPQPVSQPLSQPQASGAQQVASGAQQVGSASQQPPQQLFFLWQKRPSSRPHFFLPQHEPHDEPQPVSQPQASGAQQVASGAQQAASGAQQVGSASQQPVSQPQLEPQLFLQQNRLLRASRSGVQHFFLQHETGSQHDGSGAQQVGSGAQHVAGAGAQQVGLGAQQRGAGVQHLGVWQHEVEQPQPPPSIWFSRPAANDWLHISATSIVPTTRFSFIEQRLLMR
ncbi:hypothetical protein C5Y93_02420 [Blastopirellula marina]|uniref:Uncharacterized protein n=1 Tax=Blastopirellula marina TaxID=124 RepID=A0A2S8GTZ3_9BACT|nr:hypothetical protein C5Y93_02420 [Blastopirellula marina]